MWNPEMQLQSKHCKAALSLLSEVSSCFKAQTGLQKSLSRLSLYDITGMRGVTVSLEFLRGSGIGRVWGKVGG